MGVTKGNIPWNKGIRQKIKNRIGIRFGRLVILSISEHRDKHRNTYYDCICDCGNLATVAYNGLMSGDTRSCGCLLKEFQTERTLEAWEAAYRLFVTNAKNRKNQSDDKFTKKFDMSLTYSEYKALAILPCSYCGNGPILWKRKSIYVNGIDRLHNEQGYHLNNCVPCCIICNRAKHSMTLEKWNEWLHRIAQHNSHKL